MKTLAIFLFGALEAGSKKDLMVEEPVREDMSVFIESGEETGRATAGRDTVEGAIMVNNNQQSNSLKLKKNN
jgi:hypothetical protein